MASDDLRDRISAPTALLVALTLVVVAALAVPLSTSSAAYSPYNDEWDGATALSSMADDAGVEVEQVHQTEAYSSARPTETVALVLSPDEPYRSGDSARITDFVRRGGTLVVADDYGAHSNELLRRLNASARIDGRPVRDIRSNYRSAGMPVASNVSNHSLVADVESLTLNYGTAVRPNGATPLVNTSEYAYLDTDRNGRLSGNESFGNYTVATVEQVGEGRVVVVGDSSAFINVMLDRPGNRQFVRALLADDSRLLLDYSHTGSLPPLVFAVFLLRESALLQFALGALAIGALTVWSRGPSLPSLPSIPRLWSDDSTLDGDGAVRASSADLAASLEQRHPDWDRERIERVVSALERRRER
ncbi:DUF4350 domain-containing protein [Halorussus ruber]|uniref:DUF4350 domain-containing protein n=1 Tax=Halorussus ruber TaxID=1126238 RepID=UPI001FE26281|nr:DUF4350 domain-containing protein [Halorussus ruber]